MWSVITLWSALYDCEIQILPSEAQICTPETKKVEGNLEKLKNSLLLRQLRTCKIKVAKGNFHGDIRNLFMRETKCS